ncbi:adaptin ear-binding coat-associated protein 2 [Neohortaea acidophila]|uniref:Adaptin ear-binding coat-associated protein 2 n=1 Tax=Neohortaea acidophila TaxID=245834 RepID=A0A6A6PTA7_9PEZI|nr:adaptin ear-binding coat-associated protein 2 [Neohortaea acidophila]KAF2482914.1 adaptin ear-binding coat-associated protein 2 [Neohortaea acidophila]
MTRDIATGAELPDDAIQRIVFVTEGVHVYGIPPISSNKGFSAANWTSPTQPTAQEIFTARLRVIETSVDASIKVDAVLEDPNTGDLFAAAPYIHPAVVQQANDSSRFFAVRVEGEGGMKATLGIGFEDRSPALDFNIALSEARKVLGFEAGSAAASGRGTDAPSSGVQDSKQDFSLKEGQKIHIQLGGKSRTVTSGNSSTKQDDAAALFSIAPPPGAGKGPGQIAPPPTVQGKSAQELGFDDGEFGEFQ